MRKLILMLAICLAVAAAGYLLLVDTRVVGAHYCSTVCGVPVDSKEKVDLCHVDGEVGSQRCQTLSIPANAAISHIDQGGGTAGHELDYCGPCRTPCQ